MTSASIAPTLMKLARCASAVVRHNHVDTKLHCRAVGEVINHALSKINSMQRGGQRADIARLADHPHDFPGRMVMVNVPFRRPLGAYGASSSGGGYHRSKLFDRKSVFELEIPGLLLASHRTESPIGVTADLGVINRADITVQPTSGILKFSRGVLLALHAVGEFTVDASGVTGKLRRWLNSLALGAFDWSVGLPCWLATLLVVLLSGMIRISNRLVAQQTLHVPNYIGSGLQQMDKTLEVLVS